MQKFMEANEPTRITQAYGALKRNIIQGNYVPGQKLKIDSLRDQMGISGGTVREALSLLTADRLVVSEGQRGFRVKSASREDLFDISETRILMERVAISQACMHGDDAWESRVVASYHLLQRATVNLLEDWTEAHFEDWEMKHGNFHLALYSAATSECLRDFLAILQQQAERYTRMFRTVAKNNRQRDIGSEHDAIFEAVINRRADVAAGLLEQHLKGTLAEWDHYFAVNGKGVAK